MCDLNLLSFGQFSLVHPGTISVVEKMEVIHDYYKQTNKHPNNQTYKQTNKQTNKQNRQTAMIDMIKPNH